MNPSLLLLALCQGLFLTNNVTFIAINGLVGLALAPDGWMATLPVMAYVVGSALATGPVARSQAAWGRQRAFQLGLAVAMLSTLVCAWAVWTRQFWLLCAATVVAGYYNANAQLYRFAAAELVAPPAREKAVSWVMAGGLLGAVAGPNLAAGTRDWLAAPFAAAYLALAAVAVLGMVAMAFIRFPDRGGGTGVAEGPAGRAGATAAAPPTRAAPFWRRPVFVVAALTGALSFGVMNLLMAATPLAMQTCGLPFADAARVLQWHVIGMFAPGFFTGHLIRRFGAPAVMWAGLVLNAGCVAIALSGQDLHQFLIALFLLGVGWNFLFTGSTTLGLASHAPAEKDAAQGAMNLVLFATLALTSLASGALVTTRGWVWLNAGSVLPLLLMAALLLWLRADTRRAQNAQVNPQP